VSKIIGKPLTSTPNGSPGAGESLPPLAAIGASTGGPKALAEVLRHLPLDFLGAVIVVQHVDEGFTAGLADWLDSQTILPVRRAKEEDRPSAGRILIAGGEKHLILGPRLTLTYSAEPSELPYRPSVDQLFLSLARHWPRPGVAALLTGMGKDGAQGLLALRRAGWLTVAQDEATSMVYGMPKAAAETGAAKHVLPPNEIATKMIHFCNHNHHSNGSKPEQATGERS
jgi:two-component system response regulator WspF